ncbi:MAG: RidA family protein [Verrucomicrobiota bacterium]|jgi:enamine deaminase RidA (YjgF/YER057c/UK114 family)
MHLDFREAHSPKALELYLTARPADAASSTQEARRIFKAISGLLLQKKAGICQERVFAPPGDIAALRQIREQEYGELADGVEPAFLATNDAPGVMPGVQVYAVAMAQKPEIITAGDAQARLFGAHGCHWLTASGLRALEAGDGSAQARAAFEKAFRLLRAAGGDLRNLARTWIFMDDILSWYDQFNQARSAFFRDSGLLGPKGAGRLPASTGIGVSPADGSRCALDLFAVFGEEDALSHHEAAGMQRSANEYGSAFARAAVAKSPAGRTVFVSGTAAIDPAGVSCCRNDIAGQIQMTLDNVNAVLAQLSAESADVVQAIAYCATAQAREQFLNRWAGQVSWPWLVMIGDVCRPELLFEVEATACVGAKPLQPSR